MRPGIHGLLCTSVLACSVPVCSKTPSDPQVTGVPSQAKPSTDVVAAPNAAASGKRYETIAILNRPYVIRNTENLPPDKSHPLVILLHGYGSSGAVMERMTDIESSARARRFLYVSPDGTLDSRGQRFWNATDSCCDFEHSGIDDVSYLSGIIDDAIHNSQADPKRISILGHSNGGFMAYRMACDHSQRIAAIANIAGAMWQDASRCKPDEPVSVLHVHGDQDSVVEYAGGYTLKRQQGALQPGALRSVTAWASFNHCKPTGTPGTAFNLEDQIPGDETLPLRFVNCTASVVELWTVRAGGHLAGAQPRGIQRILDFLLTQTRP